MPSPSEYQPVKTERIGWIDAVRTAGVILVVLNHVSVPVFWGDRTADCWFSGVLTHAVTVSCVHLFFLVSGYLTFAKAPPEPKAIAQRVIRLATPWAVYTALYVFAYHRIEDTPINPPWYYLASPAEYHLWFFAPIVCIGIVSSVLRPVRDHKSGAVIVLIILLLLNAHSFRIFDIPGEVDHGLSLLANFNQIGVFLSWFLLSVLGYHLASLPASPKTIAPLTALVLGLTGYITWFTIANSTDEGIELRALDDLSFVVILHSVTLFLLLRVVADSIHQRALSVLNAPHSQTLVKKTLTALGAPIRLIAKYSLGIYGLHILTIYLYNKAAWILPTLADDTLFEHPYFVLPLRTTLVIATALLTAWLIGRIDKKGWVV